MLNIYIYIVEGPRVGKDRTKDRYKVVKDMKPAGCPRVGYESIMNGVYSSLGHLPVP